MKRGFHFRGKITDLDRFGGGGKASEVKETPAHRERLGETRGLEEVPLRKSLGEALLNCYGLSPQASGFKNLKLKNPVRGGAPPCSLSSKYSGMFSTTFWSE